MKTSEPCVYHRAVRFMPEKRRRPRPTQKHVADWRRQAKRRKRRKGKLTHRQLAILVKEYWRKNVEKQRAKKLDKKAQERREVMGRKAREEGFRVMKNVAV